MNFDALEAKIAAIIDEHEDLIYEEYNGKSDQVLLDKKLVQLIVNALKEVDQNLLHDTIKTILRDLFELEKQDIILFKNGYIFIKLVSDLEQNIPQGRKSSAEARYNGFDERELIEFYHEFITPQKNSELIESVSKRFVNEYIIKKQISNHEYEQKAFGYIKQLYFEELVKEFENDDEFIMGFAGYIFRINFEKVFEKIAQNLLEHLIKGNKSVVKFLDYYSQEVLIINNAKYRIPSIMTESGHKFKVNTILPIARIYLTTKKRLEELSQKISKLQEETKKFFTQDGFSPVEKQHKVKERLLIVSNKLKENLDMIEKLYNVVLSQKIEDDQKKALKEKIQKLKTQSDALLEEKEQLESFKLPPGVISKYQKLQKELDTLKREYNTKMSVLKQNEKSYHEIIKALVKALISKKKRIS